VEVDLRVWFVLGAGPGEGGWLLVDLSKLAWFTCSDVQQQQNLEDLGQEYSLLGTKVLFFF